MTQLLETRCFETLVVGSGPAGIAAAVSAAARGAHVGLVDDNPSAGGQIWRRGRGKPHQNNSATRWRNRLLAASTPPMQLVPLQGWSVVDQPTTHSLRAERNGEVGEVMDLQFENLILATGARECFLPFPGWTVPNVMGAGAIQAMVKSGLPVQGKRIVVAGSGPLLLAVAAYLRSAGAEVVCVCEQASASQLLPFAFALTATPGKIAEALRYKASMLGIPFYTSAWPIEASGNDELRAVTLSIRGKQKTISCDYLACGFHLVPNIELLALTGCEIENGSVKVDEWQLTSMSNIYCAGEPTGIGGLELSLIEGEIAGLAASGQKEKARALFNQRRRLSRFAARLAKAFTLRPELKALPHDNTLLCRCEDVAYGAVRQHHSWRAAKLQTRCGMGPCQGRICGAAAEFLLGWNADSVRPPVFPALISSLVSSQDHNESEKTLRKCEGD